MSRCQSADGGQTDALIFSSVVISRVYDFGAVTSGDGAALWTIIDDEPLKTRKQRQGQALYNRTKQTNKALTRKKHNLVYLNMPSRVIVVVLPLAAAILWRVLDANPSLFVYDIVIPSTLRYASLQNRTVWVTGASSGIGAEIVCQLVQANVAHGEYVSRSSRVSLGSLRVLIRCC